MKLSRMYANTNTDQKNVYKNNKTFLKKIVESCWVIFNIQLYLNIITKTFQRKLKFLTTIIF